MTWLVDVLDRELAGLTGAERDRIAKAIIEALPLRLVSTAIATALIVQFRAQGLAISEELARDVGGNAAMAVAAVLDPFDDTDDDDEATVSA
jgi:hypothetical protein